MVIDVVFSIEMVWFVNFGIEVCMFVLCLMWVFIGWEKIIKFEGCYYGYVDMFLVKVGFGVVIFGLLDFFGVFSNIIKVILIVFYNDLEVVKVLFVENFDSIVGVIFELVVGNVGFIFFDVGFLEGLWELIKEYGVLLVFDEVMIGFWVFYGGV